MLVAIFNLYVKTDGPISVTAFKNEQFLTLKADTFQAIFVGGKATIVKFKDATQGSAFQSTLVGSVLIFSNNISDGFYLVKINSKANSKDLESKYLAHITNDEYNSLMRLKTCYHSTSTEGKATSDYYINYIKNGLLTDENIHFLVTKTKTAG